LSINGLLTALSVIGKVIFFFTHFISPDLCSAKDQTRDMINKKSARSKILGVAALPQVNLVRVSAHIFFHLYKMVFKLILHYKSENKN